MATFTIHWHWEEAFSKFGFRDGEYGFLVNTVRRYLESRGWASETSDTIIHNNYIWDLRDSHGERYQLGGYENPRLVLPENIVKALDKKFPSRTKYRF